MACNKTRKANNQLCENNETKMLVTVRWGLLQISIGKSVCANAGRMNWYRISTAFVLARMEKSRYRECKLKIAPGNTTTL